MTIDFTVHAIPIAQPRQRIGRSFGGRPVAYLEKSHPVNAFKAAVQLAAANEYQGPPLDCALELSVVFVMPRPGKLLKTKPNPRYRHTKKPDLDNMLKAVKDALNGILFRDDSQVSVISAEKWVASGDESPHVVIAINIL